MYTWTLSCTVSKTHVNWDKNPNWILANGACKQEMVVGVFSWLGAAEAGNELSVRVGREGPYVHSAAGC